MGRRWQATSGVHTSQVVKEEWDGCKCPLWLRVAYRETGYVHAVPLDCVGTIEDGVLVLEGILRGRRRT